MNSEVGTRDYYKDELAECQARLDAADRERNLALKDAQVQRDNLTKMKQRAEDAEAIVAKLPRTADGVPVVPGMKLYKRAWFDDPPEVYEFDVDCCGPNTEWGSFYSTREAADAAKD